jgi:hypothetical protein
MERILLSGQAILIIVLSTGMEGTLLERISCAKQPGMPSLFVLKAERVGAGFDLA